MKRKIFSWDQRSGIKTLFSLVILGFCLITATLSHAESRESKRVSLTKHFNESLFKVTEKGSFSVEILMDDKEYRIGKDVIGVVIHDARDKDVEGAEIGITLRDDQGQPIATAPVVKEKGDGLYTVANVDLRREGKWELVITVRKRNSEDSARFVFPEVLERKTPAGKSH